MILKPMIRNNICLNSHPKGCAKAVRDEIGRVKKAFTGEGVPEGAPKLVLVIGCSTGYGLASRIVSAFGYGAATVGVSFEKAPSAVRTGTPGWYNNAAFNAEAAVEGLPGKILDGDAFSDEMKERAVQAIRETAAEAGIPPQVDLVIYSLASPVRTDPKDGVMHKSVIKPIGGPYSGTTVDVFTGKLFNAEAAPATEEEITATIKVMGGEDWELWIDALDKAGVLSPAARTVAYTYIGPELSWPIYKNGAIGRAKGDLERAARALNAMFGTGGNSSRRAWVSVNKALVTRASAVIPIIPLYVSCLFKVMKEKGIHEGCAEQITRLFRERLYTASAAADPTNAPVDDAGRIRVDDREMREDVQRETAGRMAKITEANVFELSDIAGFKRDFLQAHGFDVPGINYNEDVDPATI